jgi:hypothetical protein
MNHLFGKGATLALLGALLIANADNIDYEYAWDHSLYPPFTGRSET